MAGASSRKEQPITIFLNIGNKAEITRAAEEAVEGLIAELVAADPVERTSLIEHSVARWRAQFPKTAGTAALHILRSGLRLEAGRGQGRSEVIQRLRLAEEFRRRCRETLRTLD